MVTEIRDYDKQTVVLYTNDRAIASTLSESKKCYKVIPYEQEQHKNNRIALVGMDLYFPKKSVKWLERQVSRSRKLLKVGKLTPRKKLTAKKRGLKR